jgi:hypothetical protein
MVPPHHEEVVGHHRPQLRVIRVEPPQLVARDLHEHRQGADRAHPVQDGRPRRQPRPGGVRAAQRVGDALLTRRARHVSGTATQYAQRNDSPWRRRCPPPG